MSNRNNAARTIGRERKEHATRLLTHYLRVAFERAGARWDSDNDAEVREFVDAIVEAAVGETVEAIGREGL